MVESMNWHVPRLTATWLAVAIGTCLAGVGILTAVRWRNDLPRTFVAGPLWPRPDGSLPSVPRYRSFGLVWDLE
ncbi:MAG TPA: hypothetical protein VKR24_03780, partial [Candidatus Limnocylindrales bacterium]|nr:hypothetical protein [Candidatus Limnocylindrales bacterium]